MPLARIIENVQTKCIIFGETLRFKGKQFKQNLPQNCSKSANMATAICKFSKTFQGSISPDPLVPFLLSIFFKTILPERKNALENMANLGAPSLKKFLEYVAYMKAFLKGFLCLFWV